MLQSWAVWILSLKLQLPESGEHIISARLGFCLVIVLLETRELCIVSVHLPNLNWAVKLKYSVRGLVGGVFLPPAPCSSWGLKENTVHSSTCCKIIRAGVLGVNNPAQSAAGCAGGRLPCAPSLAAAPWLGPKQTPTACGCTPCQKCNRALFQKQGLSLALGSSVQKALSFKRSGAIFWPY